MADVFISYAREDRVQAEQIARGLSAMGLDVFWDTEIPPGQTWSDYIEGKLSACKAVIVLWSAHSTKSQWVREEARLGRDGNRLIPAKLDATPPPLGFGEVQAADLSAWRGATSDPAWTRFAQAVYNLARGPGPAPQPQAQPQPQMAWSAPPVGGADEQLTPVGYIQKCLRNYLNGNGRARRAEYGWFVVFTFFVGVAASVLDVSLFGTNPYTGAANSLILTLIAAFALIAPSAAAASRRAHDFGQSGWLAALTCIPYLGLIAALVFIFVPGQSGPNQYGPNPKGV